MIYIDLYKNLSELLESDSSTTDEESATDEKSCASAEENNPTPDTDDVRVDEEAASSKQSIETLSHVAVRTKSTQITFKLKKRSIRTQTLVTATSTFFHTKSQVEQAPEVPSENVNIENPNSETEGMTTTTTTQQPNKSTHFLENEKIDEEAYAESDDNANKQDRDYIPAGAVSTESETDSSEDEIEKDQRIVLQQGKTPQQQVKLIVFEEAIIQAFRKCRQCGSNCTISLESLVGSSCYICVSCPVNSK